MAIIMTLDNPYPHIRFNSVVFNSKVMVKTFNKSFLIISSTNFWTNHPD